MEKICIVYVTAKNKEEAFAIGEKLVFMRLAACANVIDGVTSVYRWEGKIEESDEAVLIVKTREKLLCEIKLAVRKLHSYSCPCIEAIPIIDADKEYAEWVIAETSSKARIQKKR